MHSVLKNGVYLIGILLCAGMATAWQNYEVGSIIAHGDVTVDNTISGHLLAGNSLSVASNANVYDLYINHILRLQWKDPSTNLMTRFTVRPIASTYGSITQIQCNSDAQDVCFFSSPIKVMNAEVQDTLNVRTICLNGDCISSWDELCKGG